ncbi:MAG: hypothetical protein V3T17_19530 [Pseudomonadales bacterium]
MSKIPLAATVMLVRNGVDGLETLMLHRSRVAFILTQGEQEVAQPLSTKSAKGDHR